MLLLIVGYSKAAKKPWIEFIGIVIYLTGDAGPSPQKIWGVIAAEYYMKTQNPWDNDWYCVSSICIAASTSYISDLSSWPLGITWFYNTEIIWQWIKKEELLNDFGRFKNYSQNVCL